MKRRMPVLSFCLALTLASLPVLAHHSSSIYDTTNKVSVSGIVTRVAWANPHVYIHLEQRTADGTVIAWAVEGYPPAAMRRIGWSEATLRAGDSITVTGSPTRRTTRRGLLPDSIELGNTTLFTANTVLPQLTRASVEPTAGTSSIAGTWETIANVDLYLYFYRAQMQLTSAGQQARASFIEATMSPALECIPYSSPLLMIDPDFKQVVVDDEVITINGGFAPAERKVHMNVATHDGAEASLQGHSIGRWEGDTLVIDTAAFSPHRSGNGYLGTSSGTQKHLVERLRLIDGGKRLAYSFEMSDPEYLAETVSGSAEWVYRPDFAFVREPCDLGNATEFVPDAE